MKAKGTSEEPLRIQGRFCTILAILAGWIGFAFDARSIAQIIPADRHIDWMGREETRRRQQRPSA